MAEPLEVVNDGDAEFGPLHKIIYTLDEAKTVVIPTP